MNEHTAAERRLKTDIHRKNALRKELVESIRKLNEWQDSLEGTGNVRREKKLRGTIARYRIEIEEMKALMEPLLDRIEQEIRDEMKFSEDEISEFREEVKEETKLASEARVAFEEARAAAEDAEGRKLDPEERAALRERYSRAWRAFRLVKHKLEDVRGELESEMVDKEIFKRELKRIQVERHFIKEV